MRFCVMTNPIIEVLAKVIAMEPAIFEVNFQLLNISICLWAVDGLSTPRAGQYFDCIALRHKMS
jgi:hypothetical protein